MKLRSTMDLSCGMREVYLNLEFSSPLSGQILLEREMYLSDSILSSYYTKFSSVVDFVFQNQSLLSLTNLKEILSGVRDIRNTISAMSAGKVPDDVELFEIKNLSMISETIRPLLSSLPDIFPVLPDLSDVVELLDPEALRIPSFYIYDSYDLELKMLRKDLKSSVEFKEDLYYKCSVLEERVRRSLGKDIFKYLNSLTLSLNNLAEIDIFLAKADLFIRWNLSIPNISKEKTYYQALFNPEISISLEKQGNKYQPVSLFIERNSPVVLMGANMGGKSVSLRTIALSQYMFQFGFGVPAENAEIVPVHQIFHLSGDYQDLNKGLSSFAAEMKMIDLLLKESERTNSILALLDEPARTTNPYEGKALVESLLSFLRERMLLTIVATHYNVDALDCTKMRVKGYENGRMNYELVYTQDNEAPQEAITIARSLGVNEKWLEEASRLIGKK